MYRYHEALKVVSMAIATLLLLSCAQPAIPASPPSATAGAIPVVERTPTPALTFTIQGEVTDRDTGEIIEDAVVLVDGQEAGRGHFSLTVPLKDSHRLQASALGYYDFDLIIRPHFVESKTLHAPIRLERIEGPSA